ncbi:hypothetical protein SCLCIDRAFT_1092668 [Scleroderma citrinum Foug A]|uniref:Uncharacterized protein n=1 Tax=Scleroderma citrinum Foug A TaxID=1036808 RepID=A0A0C2YJT4_9AGAM|nr:hypothetical protein SCLCIDRAFT_1092668 [Scleroderma citrinum Foug A]
MQHPASRVNLRQIRVTQDHRRGERSAHAPTVTQRSVPVAGVLANAHGGHYRDTLRPHQTQCTMVLAIMSTYSSYYVTQPASCNTLYNFSTHIASLS